MGDSNHAGYSPPMPILIPMYMYKGKLKFIFITGEAGKQVGCTKPFDDLDADHLGQELVARGIYDFERTKKREAPTTEGNTKRHSTRSTLLLNNPIETNTSPP